jgi:hypothetical protein
MIRRMISVGSVGGAGLAIDYNDEPHLEMDVTREGGVASR